MSSFKVFKNITKYAYMLSLQVVGASCIQNGGQWILKNLFKLQNNDLLVWQLWMYEQAE